MPKSVLILGAGPGGLHAAERLRSMLAEDDRVVIVDRRDEQYLGVSFLNVMRGWRTPAEITIQPSVLRERNVYFIKATVEGIDLERKRVKIDNGGADLGYDALVVALGAELSPQSVPGLAEAIASESGGEYYTRDGAARLHDLLEQFHEGRVAIVVSRLPYKCPPAPYEGALLVDDLLRGRGMRDTSTIDVYTPEPAPIAPGGPAVSEAVRQLLTARDITLHTSAALVSVDPESRSLSFSGNVQASYDLLITVPPHVPPAVVRASPLGSNGWIEIDRATMRTSVEHVWAIGDVTLLRLPNGMPMPKAAVFAAGEAEAAARDIARSFGYDAPEPDFDGRGRCWFLTAEGEAGYVDGEFLHEPKPAVTLLSPTKANFAAMTEDERRWLAHWRE